MTVNLGMAVLYVQCSKKAFIHLLYTYGYECLSKGSISRHAALCQGVHSSQRALMQSHKAAQSLPTMGKSAQHYRGEGSNSTLCILEKAAACFAFRK